MTDIDDGSDDSDEWGMEELVMPAKNGETATTKDDEHATGDEDDWAVQIAPAKANTADPQHAKEEDDVGNPMIIVDMTQIDANIHSKFDKNSVSDSDAASALRKKIEAVYDQYAKHATRISDGTVIPCGSSVWRGALMRLRDERPGHYFAPIFPPKK
jgi:hypothetical protein